MSGNISSSKQKLLILIDILKNQTDEYHILNASEICAEIKKRGVACERKSVYSDIKLLNENGFDIVNTRVPRTGYFMASREFELAEVRLMIDAIQAADFITKKKTSQLIEKMSSLVSNDEFIRLNEQISLSKRIKCDNEEIYYNIDCLNRAIDGRRQVSFKYVKHKIDEKRIVNEEKDFVVNPYALIWSNDHYYLVCNNPKYDNLMHARLDRMRKTEILDTPSSSFENVSEYKGKFDVADYANKMFNMFSGSSEEIVLVCDNSVLEDIYDRFGEDAKIRNEDSGRFVLTASAAVSEGLCAWIMQYGKKIFVRSPEKLRDMICEKVSGILDLYK